jgi:hypothetical protein
MKTYLTTAVTILAVLLLSGGGLLVTHAATPSTTSSSSSQALNLNLFGGVTSAGNQNYFIRQNGPALLAVINGDPLATNHLTYTLNAKQNGLSTSGSATFSLTGQDAVTGASVSVSGTIPISGSISGANLPFGCTTTPPYTTLAPQCTSEVPAAFGGAGSVIFSSPQTGSQGGSSGNNGYGNGFGRWSGNGNGNNSNGPASTEVMTFESAYFNPFGDAITITSLDNSIIIVTNYTQATIDWTNVVDAATFLPGSVLGSTPITGNMVQVAAEHENLVAGTAQDVGTISLSGVMTASGTAVSSLDANGGYLGTSTIPHVGASGCGSSTVVLGIQTCTETGFVDHGSYLMFSGQGQSSSIISGSYTTTWTAPAFAFTSVVTGNVSQATSFATAFGGKVS